MASEFMFDEYPPLENQDLYDEDIIKTAKEFKENNENYLCYEYIDNLYQNLTIKGEEKYYDEILKKCFDYELEEYDICNSLETDEYGLIDIWRAICFDKKREHKDLYETIMRYGGVGVYWSYDEGAAEPHGGSYNNTYILHGKVKPEYVNWVGTLYKSAYNLKNEREIELKEDAEVLIHKITNLKNKKIPIKNEIIVPV